MSTGVLVPLLPLVRVSFGLTYLQAGVLVSSFGVSYGVGQIPMAILADRFSRRLLIVLGLIGTSLAAMAVSLSEAFWQMVPCFIAMGLLGGTYHAPTSSFISQSLPTEKRGRALGMHYTGGAASFLLTPVMAVGVASLFDSWRSAFLILAIPALLVSGLLWFTTEEPRGDIAESARTSKSRREGINGADGSINAASEPHLSWVQILRSIGLLMCFVHAVYIVGSSVNAYLPLYMVDHHDVSPKLAGLVISVIAGSGMVGAPLGGALSDRLGRKQIILFSLCLAGPLLLAITKSPLGILLLMSLILYGMSTSSRGPVMESFIADVVPIGRRTTVLGIYFFVGQEVVGVATPIVGHFIDIYGLDAVLTGLALGLCVVAAVGLLIRKYI